MQHKPQVRQWCFTSFKLDSWPEFNPDRMHYLVYQVEVAPDTGRLHVQGYVEYKRSVRLNNVKKDIQDPAGHVEPRQGSRSQARAYCMKEESRHPEGGPWEFGEWICGEDKRNELAEVSEKIKNGILWNEILTDFTTTSIRYYKSLNSVWTHFNIKPRDGDAEVYNIVIFGDAGLGKTRFCHDYARRHGARPYTSYLGGERQSWWERYMGEEWALYDDFDGRVHMDVGHFKKICDRYPTNVPFKGGSVEYCTRVNLFTSNTFPIEWYERHHWDAIKRRIHHSIWWRSHSRVCETCGDQECPIIEAIDLAVYEWQFGPVETQ